tara:strand:- start:233 stop:427 length:195 start_codon:yes stop_codon:yes gene_type:complete
MNKKTDININKIKEEILNLKKNLLNLNFQKFSGQLEKTAQIKKIKREIAQLKTKQKTLNGDKNA